MMFKRLSSHIRRWNKWRKYNANSWFHKILVLLGLRNSPTLNAVMTDKEEKELRDAFEKGLFKGARSRIYTELDIPPAIQNILETDENIDKAWEAYKRINNMEERKMKKAEKKLLAERITEEALNEKKEEWIWVEGYKGTDSKMMCRDQQYEIGKTYVMPEGSNVEVCESGFHLCLGLVDVFRHYGIVAGNRFFKVKALVRKSDFDKQAEPRHYLSDSDTEPFSSFYLPQCAYSYSATGGLNIQYADNDKLAAKSIEFVRELTVDEIFENTFAKDWSEEDKNKAIIVGISSVNKLIKKRELEQKQREQEIDLVELGYSRPFANYIVNNNKYTEAYAVGTQSDLSMDMKVLTIFR